MASQSRKPNGSNGTTSARLIDAEAIRSRAELVTVSAAGIARIADEVAQGATSQLGSLDAALGDMNEVVASLIDTAGQAESRHQLERGHGVVSERDRSLDRAGVREYGEPVDIDCADVGGCAAVERVNSVGSGFGARDVDRCATGRRLGGADGCRHEIRYERHRVPHVCGERNRRVDRRNFAVDRGCRFQCD